MKKGGMKFFVVMIMALALCMVSVQAQAGRSGLNAVLTMDPGEATVREFVVYDQLDISKLGPVESFLAIGMGDNTTKMGDLTITIKPTATKTFGSELDFCLIGFVYPLGGKGEFFNMETAAPLTIAQTVKMKAIYGFALVGVYIKNITGDVSLPVPFSITLSWASAK